MDFSFFCHFWTLGTRANATFNILAKFKDLGHEYRMPLFIIYVSGFPCISGHFPYGSHKEFLFQSKHFNDISLEAYQQFKVKYLTVACTCFYEEVIIEWAFQYLFERRC